jgi:Dopa 4,5-dioxygenase family
VTSLGTVHATRRRLPYFDHRIPERAAEASAFRQQLARAFAATPHLEVSSLHAGPRGPHPRGSFEVLFTREVFTDYVAWLMFVRPEHLTGEHVRGTAIDLRASARPSARTQSAMIEVLPRPVASSMSVGNRPASRAEKSRCCQRHALSWPVSAR